MKKNSLTILTFFLLALLYGFVHADADENSRQIPTEQQKEKLAEIDKYITWQRQAMEDIYQSRISRIRLLAEEKARLIEEAQAALRDISKVQDQTAQADLEETTARNVFREIIENSPQRLTERQNAIDRDKADLARLERQILQLEKQKDLLSGNLNQLEKQLKENALKPEPKPTRGMVTGIVFSRDKQTALIDRRIVHPRDKIHGVMIAGIQPDTVNFEKNGAGWTQKVRQFPHENWK